MKHLLTLTISLIFLTVNINAQKLISISKGCSYYEEIGNKQIYVKECKNSKIIKIIDDILSTISLQKNFDIYEANVENAIATNYENHRLIIIDPNFLDAIESETKDKFTSYLIIAHEIGHHLNAHIEKPSQASPFWDELEADHFAGAALQKLGILPKTINNVTNLIAPQMSSSKTHPEWQARMKAAINGYTQSAFVEVKRNISLTQKFDLNKILLEEKQLEQVLNNNIYNKADWERNIRYRVINRKIIKEFETNYYNGKEQTSFIKEKDTLDINSITKIYLRWHDPGEVAFETPNDFKIETLQNKEISKQLNPNWYFDNEITITDDLNILLKISTFVAKIQRLFELHN